MPAASSTARPAITATAFTNGSNVGNNAAIVDAQDVLTMTLTNPLITVTAGASVDLRDDDGDLFRLTNGSNATFSVGGPSSDTVTIVLTGAPTVVEDGPNPVSALEAPTGGSFFTVFATSGIANANGGLNLAESGLTAAEAGSINIATPRTRVFGATNAVLPDELSDPDPADPDVNNNVDVNADTDQVIVKGTTGSGLTAGDTIQVFDKNGVQVGTGTYPVAPPPSGFPIAISPGFAPGDRLYIVYVDNDGVGTSGAPSRMPSETEALSNPSDIPTLVVPSPQPPGNHLNVTWIDDDNSSIVTQTGPANNYQVFDTQNSVLKATATAVAGSPGSNFVLTLDTALPAGSYVLRVAANTVQDANNTPNIAETHAFTLAVAAGAPTLTIQGGPADGSTVTTNSPSFNGVGADSNGTVTDVRVSVDGGVFASIGAGNITGVGTANVSWSFTMPPQSEGVHIYRFETVDNDGLTSADNGTPAPAEQRSVLINAAPATVLSAEVIPNTVGTDLRITFSEAVDCNGTGNDGALTGDAFAWTDNSLVPNGVNDSFAANSTAVITQGPGTSTCDIDAPTPFTDAEDFGPLSYTQPIATANRIRDIAGNTDIGGFTVTANDTSAPTISAVAGKAGVPGHVEITLSERVACSQIGLSDFAVTVNGTPATVVAVSGGTTATPATCAAQPGNAVYTLTLGSNLIAGNAITVTPTSASAVPNEQGTLFAPVTTASGTTT
jgi:hypothetical protein